MGNNVIQKGIKIELSGKDRRLIFDLNSFVELEEDYGDIQEAFNQLQKMNFKAIRKLLHAALLHENLTETEVGNLIDMSNMSTVMSKITEAFKTSLPDVHEDEVKNKQASPKNN
ncbi:hypothetical protein [Chengkuizengella marina]|uniref:Phage tail assembly chaperone protein, TAC n=1 Tax=Chengkuizengella marina TaxID=2507566 RepID=A0A6N9Q7Y8_9BACL|nr:hypothetical protein [Chengkuizengella marina]NBI30734.1 hypothetical protein [Chengkuizengella marina]